MSVPERALLEMLCDVGKHQSMEEARHLTESLPAQSPAGHIDVPLTHCDRRWTLRTRSGELLAGDFRVVALCAEGRNRDQPVVSRTLVSSARNLFTTAMDLPVLLLKKGIHEEQIVNITWRQGNQAAKGTKAFPNPCPRGNLPR